MNNTLTNPSDDNSDRGSNPEIIEPRIPQSPEIEAALLNETPELLKAVGKRFEASPITLKSWVKQQRLPATQASQKAPYFVRPCDVGKLLLESPNVGSVFFPSTKDLPPTVTLGPVTDLIPPRAPDWPSIESAEPLPGPPVAQSVRDAEKGPPEAPALSVHTASPIQTGYSGNHVPISTPSVEAFPPRLGPSGDGTAPSKKPNGSAAVREGLLRYQEPLGVKFLLV